MRIAFVGKFRRMDDEEYIALGFEALGHEVYRIEDHKKAVEICMDIDLFKPELVLWTKLNIDAPAVVLSHCKLMKYRTACWVFDLYFGYQREYLMGTHPAFKADYVFTTDGGHDKEFKELGINHHCVRQGIANAECYLEPVDKKAHGVVFVGTDNAFNTYRTEMITEVKKNFTFEWIGRDDPHEMRGTDLNKLYAKKKIVVGDSVFSPHYWSNRVVETLGRGGVLIHVDVPGLKEEYPHILTYPKGDWIALKNTIYLYSTREDMRQELRQKNFEWVRDNYTVDKKCAELLSYIK